MTLAAILPMAFVMIAGPQIISSFFLATSSGWAKNSIAYVGGAAISITTFVTIAFVVGEGATGDGGSSGSNDAIDWVILALVIVLAVRVYLTRATSEPPKWMSKLQQATPKFAFTLGLVLLGIFPTDILTSVAAGLHIARHGDEWWQCLPFVALTLLLLGAPAIMVLALGKRASTVLPKIQQWMDQQAWVVSEVVLVFFGVITVNSLVSG